MGEVSVYWVAVPLGVLGFFNALRVVSTTARDLCVGDVSARAILRFIRVCGSLGLLIPLAVYRFAVCYFV